MLRSSFIYKLWYKKWLNVSWLLPKKNSSVKIILFERYLYPLSVFSFAFKCVKKKKNAKSLIWTQDTHRNTTTFNQFNRKLKKNNNINQIHFIFMWSRPNKILMCILIWQTKRQNHKNNKKKTANRWKTDKRRVPLCLYHCVFTAMNTTVTVQQPPPHTKENQYQCHHFQGS